MSGKGVGIDPRSNINIQNLPAEVQFLSLYHSYDHAPNSCDKKLFSSERTDKLHTLTAETGPILKCSKALTLGLI